MSRLIPPYLFILLLAPLMFLWMVHPENLLMRNDREMPWDIPLIVGLGALIWARVHFKKKNAEIHTFRKPNNLVVDGPFRFSRNPMYLGFGLILLAGAFFVNTWCALLVPIAFFLICNSWYVRHEEGKLREVFGSAYDDYAWRTRRWI